MTKIWLSYVSVFIIDVKILKASFSSKTRNNRKVSDFIANDRNAFLKMTENALNLNRNNIQISLHEDLSKTKVWAKFIPHTLTNEPKSTIVNHSRDVFATARNDPNFHKSIVTDDETRCFQYDPTTKRKVQNGSRKIHLKPKKHEKHLQKLRQCLSHSLTANELSTKNSLHLVKQLLPNIIQRFWSVWYPAQISRFKELVNFER